jgi:A/G-specific adenine glycosylase
VPDDPGALQHLPGVGPYTASAVAAIAFGRPVVAMDVNVRRVASRVVLGREPEDRDDPRIAAAARVLLDRRDPATWNQAMMDLGREVCRPAPRCEVCPLEPWCRFRSAGRPGRSAVAPKQSPFEGSNRQVRGRIVAVLRERPSAGLLGLAAATGFGADRIGSAVTGLVRDGIVERRGRSFRLPVSRPSERSNREPGRSSDSFSLSAAIRPEG